MALDISLQLFVSAYGIAGQLMGDVRFERVLAQTTAVDESTIAGVVVDNTENNDAMKQAVNEVFNVAYGRRIVVHASASSI